MKNAQFKLCTACKKWKCPTNDFYSTSTRGHHCKACRRSEAKIRQMLRKYGMTVEQYNVMANLGCHICGSTDCGKGKSRLCIDHDHSKTGIESVRGVLCENCNIGLGRFKDSPELLQKALAYRIRFTSTGTSSEFHRPPTH